MRRIPRLARLLAARRTPDFSALWDTSAVLLIMTPSYSDGGLLPMQ